MPGVVLVRTPDAPQAVFELRDGGDSPGERLGREAAAGDEFLRHGDADGRCRDDQRRLGVGGGIERSPAATLTLDRLPAGQPGGELRGQDHPLGGGRRRVAREQKRFFLAVLDRELLQTVKPAAGFGTHREDPRDRATLPDAGRATP